MAMATPVVMTTEKAMAMATPAVMATAMAMVVATVVVIATASVVATERLATAHENEGKNDD